MKNKKPLVSVIMSVYNDKKFLKKSINSILNQNYKNFEFIIIDDGSTNSIKKILNKYKNNKKIIIINNKANIGLARSLNHGIKISKGKYIARMDADDYSFRSRLKDQVKFLEKNKNISILGSQALIEKAFSEKKEKTKLPSSNLAINFCLNFKNPLMHSSIMMRKSIFKKMRGYDKNYMRCQDYELWLRSRKYYNFSNLNKVLIKYKATNNYNSVNLYYFIKSIIRHVLITKSFIFGIYGILNHVLIFSCKKIFFKFI